MTTEMQEIPTAQYYTTTHHAVAKLIRLLAILSIIIGGVGLLEMALTLGALLLGKLIFWSWTLGSPLYALMSLATWVLAPLRLLIGIGCLYRKDLARRGMVAFAILTIIWSAAFTCVNCYSTVAARIRPPYGPGGTQLDQAIFALHTTSGFIGGLLLPLLILTLFRSEEAKQFFKPET